MTAPLLEACNLSVRFETERGTIHAVNGVSLSLAPGRTLCVVGESGSGKSVTAMALLGLLPRRTARVTADRLVFDGTPLLSASERRMRRIRGGGIGVIFQDPGTSLNPAHTVGMQIEEGIRAHAGLSARDARRRAVEMLDLVRIPDAARRLGSYPHELSGGMRQRVMIAMALACRPRLLIADEPTTALDVTVQAQILTLIEGLKEELGLAVLLITHDFGVVADVADEVLVLYAGQPMEAGDVHALFDAPAHPYTRGLMAAMPALEGDAAGRLAEIPGSVPRLSAPPAGCTFAPRCPHAAASCTAQDLAAHAAGSAHVSWCLRHEVVAAPRYLAEAGS